jgi:hypothetical protein
VGRPYAGRSIITIKQKSDAELRPGAVRECQFPEQFDLPDQVKP